MRRRLCSELSCPGRSLGAHEGFHGSGDFGAGGCRCDSRLFLGGFGGDCWGWSSGGTRCIISVGGGCTGCLGSLFLGGCRRCCGVWWFTNVRCSCRVVHLYPIICYRHLCLWSRCIGSRLLCRGWCLTRLLLRSGCHCSRKTEKLTCKRARSLLPAVRCRHVMTYNHGVRLLLQTCKDCRKKSWADKAADQPVQ